MPAVRFLVHLRSPLRSLQGRSHLRSISPNALLLEHIEKQGDRLFLMFEVMDHRLAFATDPAPAPREAGFSKQRPVDRERVEPRHVPVCVGSLDIEMVGLTKHGMRIAYAQNLVQREF